VDRELGIYRYDPLILLHTAKMPAVLFEAGVILNRRDEIQLAGTAHQDIEIGAILDSVDRFCASR
jgi:N-acetylmuramoyl-L-alanine amidase